MVHFRAPDHPLLRAKLLPPCHYGDTGCYTSANQCRVRDVQKCKDTLCCLVYAQEVVGLCMGQFESLSVFAFSSLLMACNFMMLKQKSSMDMEKFKTMFSLLWKKFLLPLEWLKMFCR